MVQSYSFLPNPASMLLLNEGFCDRNPLFHRIQELESLTRSSKLGIGKKALRFEVKLKLT